MTDSSFFLAFYHASSTRHINFPVDKFFLSTYSILLMNRSAATYYALNHLPCTSRSIGTFLSLNPPPFADQTAWNMDIESSHCTARFTAHLPLWIPVLSSLSAVSYCQGLWVLSASIKTVVTGLAVSSLGFLGMGSQSFKSSVALT